MTVTKEWVGVPAVGPYDAPPQREEVCHIGVEVIAPGLYRSHCGKTIAEPFCCGIGEPPCGRKRCGECQAVYNLNHGLGG